MGKINYMRREKNIRTVCGEAGRNIIYYLAHAVDEQDT